MLLSRVTGSDSQALAWLLHETARFARRAARGNRMDAADANDLAQGVLLAILERVPALREPACLPGCLATMIGRQARRVLLRRQREHPLAPRELPCPGLVDSPELSALRVERDRAVWLAATCLPSARARRLVWLLAYRPELTQEQLAAELDVAPGTIGPLRRRSLDVMRGRLRAQGYDATDVSG